MIDVHVQLPGQSEYTQFQLGQIPHAGDRLLFDDLYYTILSVCYIADTKSVQLRLHYG